MSFYWTHAHTRHQFADICRTCSTTDHTWPRCTPVMWFSAKCAFSVCLGIRKSAERNFESEKNIHAKQTSSILELHFHFSSLTYSSERGRISHFSVDLHSRPWNTLALPCQRGIIPDNGRLACGELAKTTHMRLWRTLILTLNSSCHSCTFTVIHTPRVCRQEWGGNEQHDNI